MDHGIGGDASVLMEDIRGLGVGSIASDVISLILGDNAVIEIETIAHERVYTLQKMLGAEVSLAPSFEISAPSKSDRLSPSLPERYR